jgi:hypothetical protein
MFLNQWKDTAQLSNSSKVQLTHYSLFIHIKILRKSVLYGWMDMCFKFLNLSTSFQHFLDSQISYNDGLVTRAPKTYGTLLMLVSSTCSE